MVLLSSRTGNKIKFHEIQGTTNTRYSSQRLSYLIVHIKLYNIVLYNYQVVSRVISYITVIYTVTEIDVFDIKSKNRVTIVTSVLAK